MDDTSYYHTCNGLRFSYPADEVLKESICGVEGTNDKVGDRVRIIAT